MTLNIDNDSPKVIFSRQEGIAELECTEMNADEATESTSNMKYDMIPHRS